MSFLKLFMFILTLIKHLFRIHLVMTWINVHAVLVERFRSFTSVKEVIPDCINTPLKVKVLHQDEIVS